MDRFLFWQRWLLVVGALLSFFGFALAFLSGTPAFDAFNAQVNGVFWAGKDVSAPVRVFQQWIYGVLGAAIGGWGVFMAFIARYPFKKKEKWVRNCFTGVLAWFLVDTSISVYLGVHFNVIFNVIIFTLVALPFVFTWRFLRE